MNLNPFLLTLSPPDDAGSGGAASGGGGLPDATGQTAVPTPEQTAAGATPQAPPTERPGLPENFWDTPIEYETSSGKKTATIREAQEMLRRQNQGMNAAFQRNSQLEQQIQQLEYEIQQLSAARQPEPAAPSLPAYPDYSHVGAEDDPVKPIFDFLKVQDQRIQKMEQEARTKAEQEKAAQARAQYDAQLNYNYSFVNKEMNRYPDLQNDHDAEIAIVNRYVRLRDPYSNPAGFREYQLNPQAAAEDAVRGYLRDRLTSIHSGAKSILERQKAELEKNKAAAVAGPGGLTPIPQPGQQRTEDWSPEARRRHYEKRMAEAKAQGALSET